MGKILRYTVGEPLKHVRTLSLLFLSFSLLCLSSSLSSLLLFSLLLCGVLYMWVWCWYTWGRLECTHGGFFSESHHTPPHHTHQTHHNTITHHPTPPRHHKGHSSQHNTTPPHPHTTHINLMPPETVEWSLRLNLPRHRRRVKTTPSRTSAHKGQSRDKTDARRHTF